MRISRRSPRPNPLSLNNLSAGFTLIELMFSLTILIIALLGALTTVVQVDRNASLARKTSLACNLCQSKIEEIKSFGYNAAFNSDEYNIDEEGQAGGVFYRSVRITNGPVLNTKLITVTVSWQDSIKTHQVSFPTLIANVNT